MTDEQLKKGIAIQSNIDEMKKHLSDINEFTNTYTPEKPNLNFKTTTSLGYANYFSPLSEFIDIREMLDNYKHKVELCIEKLEKQFAKL